ncbi:hypothetical protein BpHYR1_005252 [Brachionus plicatilis]|uniref:Uncharacterized protein n=1 Tax=Brachionus plicatilis TaxID=10195 RepID=A0A3M7SGG8_BRAPC|nr:hypothetical protein BpHYR1_005252 [Brachionus plicatilis]
MSLYFFIINCYFKFMKHFYKVSTIIIDNINSSRDPKKIVKFKKIQKECLIPSLEYELIDRLFKFIVVSQHYLKTIIFEIKSYFSNPHNLESRMKSSKVLNFRINHSFRCEKLRSAIMPTRSIE